MKKLSVLYVTTGRINPDGALYYPPLVANQINSLRSFLEKSKAIIVRSMHPLFLWRRILEIKRVQPEYDLVHAQYGSMTAFVALLGKGRKPFVISFGGSDLLGTAGDGLKWIIRNWITKQLGLFSAYRSNKIIVKSETLLNALPEKLQTKAIIIPNGVDVTIFNPRDRSEARKKLGWSDAGHYVLFTPSRANNVLVKNLPLANTAVSMARNTVGNVFLEFILDKTPDQVSNMMNAADCLLLTSFHEGSPNVIKEAMACNLPVVSVNVGDVRERLQSVSHSFVVDGYDPDDISKRLIQVLKSQQRTDGFEQLKKQKLTSDEVATRILNVYNEVLA